MEKENSATAIPSRARNGKYQYYGNMLVKVRRYTFVFLAGFEFRLLKTSAKIIVGN